MTKIKFNIMRLLLLNKLPGLANLFEVSQKINLSSKAARKARPTGPPETTDGHGEGTMEDLTERPWPSLAFGRNPFPGQEVPEE